MASQTTNLPYENPFRQQNPFSVQKKRYWQPNYVNAGANSSQTNLRMSYMKQSVDKPKASKNFSNLQNMVHLNSVINKNMLNDIRRTDRSTNSFQRYMLSSRCTPFQSRINQKLSESKYSQLVGYGKADDRLLQSDANTINLKLQNPFFRKHLLRDNYISHQNTLDLQQITRYEYPSDSRALFNLQKPYIYQSYIPSEVAAVTQFKIPQNQKDQKAQPAQLPPIIKEKNSQKMMHQLVKKVVLNGGKQQINVKGKYYYKVPLYKQI